MKKVVYYIYLLGLFMLSANLIAQEQNAAFLQIKGTVKTKERGRPLSRVEVSVSSGDFVYTDYSGKYKVRAKVGDVITFSGDEFITVRHLIESDEEIDVLVEGIDELRLSKSKISLNSVAHLHQRLLDSANFYRKTDIAKSINFVAQSIELLDKRPKKKQLAASYKALGDVYSYHQQFDLALDNYLLAYKASKTPVLQLELAKTYLRNKKFGQAKSNLVELSGLRKLTASNKVVVNELLGDIAVETKQFDEALIHYGKALDLSKKHKILHKETDLNSKIATVYGFTNETQKAEGYFNSSLEIATKENKGRAIKQREIVADFYNNFNSYDKEIELRKKSLEEVKKINAKQEGPVGIKSNDSISVQQINFKIANAFVAQEKYEEAIPYLEESIIEAKSDNDLKVQKDARLVLSEVHKNVGDYGKALENYQKYVSIMDTLYTRKEKEISNIAKLNRDIVKQQSRIVSLEQDRELSESKLKLSQSEQKIASLSAKKQLWLIYSLVGAVFLFVVIAVLFYINNVQQRKANHLLALKSLRSQMNPHFIFNALNSVNNFIAKNDERSANRYLSEFSVLMRSVLENSEEDFIPLSKEIELLQLYVKLEHSRFQDKFDYSIAIDENIPLSSYQIPPMLLQPYIENAIWHGLRYKENKGKLEISFQRKTSESIIILIKDNGIGRTQSMKLKTKNQTRQKSKGMRNIKSRINILNTMHKKMMQVNISDAHPDGTGTWVEVILNKKQ